MINVFGLVKLGCSSSGVVRFNSMEVQQRLSQYFEECDSRRFYPCPMGKVFDGFLRQFCNRKALLQLVAIACVFYLLYLSTGKIPEWFHQGLLELEDQPSDGATGGNSGSTSGHSSGKSPDSGGSGSHGAAQAPPAGGSDCSSGSSSGGDNGDDDPRKYHRPEDHKSVSHFECEEEENDDRSGDLATGHEYLKYNPENMVTSKLPPVQLAGDAQLAQVRRVDGPTLSSQVSSQSSSSAHFPMFNFDRSQELKFCRLEKEPSVDQPTPEYYQQEISAASMEEEYMTLSASSETMHPGGIPMNTLPFWTVINHMLFVHPNDVPDYPTDLVSQESILANQVQTFTDLAQLEDVQIQVLEAAGATEPFGFTLAFMLGDEHAATLVPLPSNMPFDPSIDAIIVAIPADCVLANFTIRVNPLLRQHL